jgi:hypothetical protein
MFWALLVTRQAVEPAISASRVVAALLQTQSVTRFCEDAAVTPAELIRAIEDPHALAFEEGVRRVGAELAAADVRLGTREHIAAVQPLPLVPGLQKIMNVVLDHGLGDITSLEVLLAIVESEPLIARGFAERKLTTEMIRARLSKD